MSKRGVEVSGLLTKGMPEGQMFQYIQLGDLVPEDHLLRRIRAVLKLDAIYEATKGCYSADTGRPSVDPTVAFRMILLGYLYNLSEKRMCEEVAMHAGYRWFCGLDFNSRVPDRTTLVKLRRHTWGEKVFREVMQAIVGQCVAAGLVKGKAIVVDGSQVRARAAVTSMEAIEPALTLEEYFKDLTQGDTTEDAADQESPPEGPSGGPGANRLAGNPDFHGERFSNRTHRSKTDPDARLFAKGHKVGAMLSYLVHDLMDLKSGVVLDTMATHAYGALERAAALQLTDNVAKVHGRRLGLRYLLADANYTEAAFLAEVLDRGIEPIVPTRTVSKAKVPGPLRRRVIALDLADSHRRNVRAALAAQHVRHRERPPELSRARTRIERTFAEAKEHHGLRRARGIGLEMMNIQALMTATVQNLRRLANASRRTGAGEAKIQCSSAFQTISHALTLLRVWLFSRRFRLNFSLHF